MSLLGNLSDAISYNIHRMTYNPEAEQYAKEKAAAEQKAKEDATAQKANATAKSAAEAKAKEEVEVAAKAKKAEEERKTFSASRLASNVLSILMKILVTFLILVLGVYGASLSANLNLYREYPYRILYAIYGFFLFMFVIPYILLYRWWWNGKKPRFYGLIPIIAGKFVNPTAQTLFGWLTFKPDDRIHALEEWNQSLKK
jgi:hypothetical protein